ncbi:MFS transporter [Pseudonocardia sulfidoxydans]|nr:MFS transporter [Pseudonocardia sulfidoxydans]
MNAPADDDPGRSSLRLLLDPVYGPYFVGNLFAATGIWLYTVTAAVLVYQHTGSVVWVGLTGAVTFAGSLVLAPWAGVLSDRTDRRRLLILGRTLSALSCGGLALWIGIVGDGSTGPWPILVASALLGVSSGLTSPAQMAIVPHLVPAPDLHQAVALGSVTWNIARAVGPALGAAITGSLGAVAACWFTCAGYAMFVLVMLFLRLDEPRRDGDEGDTGSFREGLRFVRGRPDVSRALWAVAALSLAVDPVITVTPSLARTLGASDTFVGVLGSAFGAGSVVAIVALRPLRRRWGLRRTGAVGAVVVALGMFGVGVGPTAWAASVAAFVGGLGLLAASSSLTSQLQQDVPEVFRGRVMALWGVAFMGTRPLASLLDGALAELLGPRPAICLISVTALAAGWWARRDPAAGRLTVRTPGPSLGKTVFRIPNWRSATVTISKSAPTRVADSDQIPEGGRLVVDVDDRTVGVFRFQGALYAYDNTCAHQGGPVCQGRLIPRVAEVLDHGSDRNDLYFDDGDPHIVCPWHGYEYSLTTGRHAGIDAIGLTRYDVNESDGGVYVRI